MGEPRRPLTFFLFAYWHDPQWKGFVGATVKIRDLAENLHRMGHRVLLFIPACGITGSESSFEIMEIPVIDRSGWRALSFNFFLLLRLMATRRSDRPDVIYLRRTTTLVPLLYSKLTGARFFFELNDDPYRNLYIDRGSWKSVLRNTLSLLVDHLNMSASDRIFAISREIIKEIRRLRPAIPAARFRLMPSGANLSLFSPMPREDAQTITGLDASARYIGFAGTLLPHQGIGTLIDAAEFILARCPGCRFVIMGEGPVKDSLRTMAESRSMGRSFIFTGQIPYEKLPAWINAMDICVAPYAANAGYRSPVKIFDYLACGRPVVASRIAGTTDRFEPIGSVHLVEPDRPLELAEAIVFLLDNATEAGLMGMKGRQWVNAHGSRADMAFRIVQETNYKVLSE